MVAEGFKAPRSGPVRARLGEVAYPDVVVGVDVAFDATPPLENTATVAGGGEVDTANDEAVDTTSPEPAADLAIAKTGQPDEPRPGGAVTYVM